MSLIKAGDLAEIKFGTNIINTRILTISENVINVTHEKTNSIISIRWNGSKWIFENNDDDDDSDISIDYVKFMKSAKKARNDRFPIGKLDYHSQMQVLLNAAPTEFMNLCKMSEFDAFCNGFFSNRLYMEKLERDIVPRILALGEEFKPANMSLQEFYRRLIALQNYIKPEGSIDIIKGSYTLGEVNTPEFIMETLINNNLDMEAKILLKLDPKYKLTERPVDFLAMRHRYKLLNYFRENGYMDALDLQSNSTPYLRQWVLTGR